MDALKIDSTAIVPLALAVLIPLLPDGALAAVQADQSREYRQPERVWFDAARILLRLGCYLGEPKIEAHGDGVMLLYTATDGGEFGIKVFDRKATAWWRFDVAGLLVADGEEDDFGRLALVALKMTGKERP